MPNEPTHSVPAEKKIIDFRELRDTVQGEELEALTEHMLKAMGYETFRSGRGPDGGKDLMSAEPLASEFVTQNRRWLVQCKHLARSARAANEDDVAGVVEKCAKHEADGYLLVTTTVATNELTKLFEKLTASKEHRVVAAIWDEHRLRELLLTKPALRDVLKRFLPESFARVETLEPEAILIEKLRTKGVSDGDLVEIQAAISGALDSASRRAGRPVLASRNIYPAATAYRAVIDQAASHFVANQLADAAEQLEGLPFEEWEASINAYASHDRARAELLMRHVAEGSPDETHRFAAVRRLVQDWGYDVADVQVFLSTLDSESVRLLLADSRTDTRVREAVEHYIFEQSPNDLDDLPPHTVDEVYVESVAYNVEHSSLCAEAEFSVSVSYLEGEGMGGSFPGTAKISIHSWSDPVIEQAHIDVRSFFGDGEDEADAT